MWSDVQMDSSNGERKRWNLTAIHLHAHLKLGHGEAVPCTIPESLHLASFHTNDQRFYSASHLISRENQLRFALDTHISDLVLLITCQKMFSKAVLQNILA